MLWSISNITEAQPEGNAATLCYLFRVWGDSPFPKTDKRVPFHLGCNSISVPIFCLCRLPKDRKEYVECFSCHGLYHPDCVSIPEWAVKSRLQWNCQKCRNTMAKMGSKNILAGFRAFSRIYGIQSWSQWGWWKVDISNLFNLTFPMPTVLRVSTTVLVSSNEACNSIFSDNFLPKPTQQMNYLTSKKTYFG